MSFEQLSAIQIWHRRHGRHAVEAWAWDAVVMLWLLGWVATPVLLLLGELMLLAAVPLLLLAPAAYAALRRRLHRRGRLRCDWLSALR